MHNYSTDPVVLHHPWSDLRTVIHDHSVKWHAGPLTSSRLSPVDVIHLSLGIKHTDNTTCSQTLRAFLAISFLLSADVDGLHLFLFVNMIHYHSLWFIINNMEQVNVHVVQHVVPPTFSLAILLRNKPNDEWMQLLVPPSTATEVPQNYWFSSCTDKLNSPGLMTNGSWIRSIGSSWILCF